MDTVNWIRYKATIAYDGTLFSGFQIQPKGRTVQGEIEKALKQISKNDSIRIHPSGRTDAGVHAAGMVIHFDFPCTIPVDGVFRALSVLLPTDISILQLEQVDKEFHARYLAVGKTYTYRVDNNKIHNPFNRLYCLHHPYSMDDILAQHALDVLLGTHDFTSFSSAKTVIEDKVRTIYSATVEVDSETNEWTFTFIGDGFLYNMIRIIMGTVIEIADGRIDLSKMESILQAKDRNQAGKTIAAHGLRLEKVYYDDEVLKNEVIQISHQKNKKPPYNH